MSTEKTEPVEYVFKRLAATYGSAWDRALGNAPISDVKTIWADVLSGFLHTDDSKRLIVWALQNLPERCPNAIEFRNLCRSAPSEKFVELPKAEQKANPAIVAAIVGGLSKPVPQAGRLDWAKAILDESLYGMKKSPTVIRMAKDALGVE